jgi:hypothetical protein
VKKAAVGLKSWWIHTCLLGLSMLLLAGCGEENAVAPTVSANPPLAVASATASIGPTAEPTEIAIDAPISTPTVASVALAEDTSADWVNVASVEGDLYIRGNPNAPIRLLDYSDFL